VKGTSVGFAVVNGWFHELTGVNMELYNITDWLGLVPVLICMIFGWIGLVQWIRRKSIFKVDYDVIILGVYYVWIWQKSDYH
jgi:undecaprenyl-diphosphatase